MTQLNSNSVNFYKKTDNDVSKENIPVQSTRTAILILVGIFLLSVSALVYLYKSFPELEEEEAQYVKLPMDIEDAKNLGKVLARYKERYYFTVLFAFFLTYIFLQSFAIPGSIFLSILSGFLYPYPLAILLVCSCSALGASFCYLLSSQLGRKIVKRFFPERAAQWSRQVNKHHSNLLNYIIFLRITPFLPNWFINITSPVIGVPAKPFILGTFIGVAPPSFVMIQAGTTLHQLTSSKDAISGTSIFMLTLLALLSLLPILFKKKLSEKLD
ncbi:transmembrane protein 41B [Parasteatoda tepidariorum]|uniref:transmembrane protein 41B n=1 Tax=Parasteatoda tepidariorum TaxID=114398 RepID=UPI00077F8351|nr:transmembrane protein 41B [Parasteatoda tepidariorum]